LDGLAAERSALVHNLRVLRRGAWLVLLTTALVTATALLLSLRQPRLYEASADVFLSGQDLAASLSPIQLPSADPVRESATQSSLAQTPLVARRAVRLARIPGLTAGGLLDSSSVNAAPNADLLTFSVTRRDATEAASLATAYARAYTAYRRAIDTGSLVRARRQLEQRMAELESSGDRDSAMYAGLAEKDQQLRTLEVLQGSNALLVREASEAVQIQPKPTRNAILGGILGLILGIGLAFLREALNTRVRSVEEIEERLGLPLLARLPEPSRKLRARSRLAMIEEPHAPEAEAYRILATNFDFVNLDRGARTVMITSATGQEGKSTTVANLAVALARSGRRVVLVDLDLRRPSIDDFFDLEAQPGLTHVILGRSSLDEALVAVPPANRSGSAPSSNGAPPGYLEVLPTGPLPPNPAEFASSHALDELLHRLQARADVVLLDAPPMLHLSDSIALTAKVDAVLIVTRLSSIRRSTLEELRRTLDSVPVVKLGFVLTGVPAGDGYGYGYGYSYGYGETKSRRGVEREVVR
jgi:succinoglycan biosynthesis transport protein ExoP